MKLFSIEKVNGLSPLTVETNPSKNLRTLVFDLFIPPPKYPRDHPTNNTNSDTSDNGDNNVIVMNDEDSNSNNYIFMKPNSMVNIVITHMIDTQVIKGHGE